MAAALDYLRPASVAEALSLLSTIEGAQPVAGATDVWVGIRSKKHSPKALVSLKNIPNLRFILPDRETDAYEGRAEGVTGDSGVLLGAATTHGDVEDSAWMKTHFPAVHQACSGVGSRQVRNVATVGGNICNAAPCADSAVGLLLYDATLVIAGPAGERELPLSEFFVGPGETRLGPAEILKEVKVPNPGPRTYAWYWKHTRRKGVELPLLGVGARVTLDADGMVEKARVSLGVCAPMPTRSYEAEKVLEGQKLTAELAAEAGEVAAANALVRDTWRGRGWYRREMVRVLVPRVIKLSGALS
ncbi:MAG: xanthine dehydrogenase family protein subunit M [Actinobacteria bacterium]|nr:xanthine dehydrogenase family protein subunit M [Actinomycetota bacterium]